MYWPTKKFIILCMLFYITIIILFLTGNLLFHFAGRNIIQILIQKWLCHRKVLTAKQLNCPKH